MKQIHALILLLLFILVSACGTSRRGEPLTGGTRPESGPVLRGQQLFQKHCDQCHPGGESGVGPAINNKALPAFMMKMQVRTGLGAMPSFSKEQLKGDELDDVITYLQELRRQPCCRNGINKIKNESTKP